MTRLKFSLNLPIRSVYSNKILKNNFSTSIASQPLTAKSNDQNLKLPLFSPGFDPKLTNKIAFTDWTGKNFTYQQIADYSLSVANELQRNFKEDKKTRVSIMCPHNSTFLTSLWATWMTGHIAVPLSANHPSNLLEYFMTTTKSEIVLTTQEYADLLHPVAKTVGSKLVVVDYNSLYSSTSKTSATNQLNEDVFTSCSYIDKDALILFTSGTTGKPKGVLLTHSNLEAQTGGICDALGITADDSLLHTLPLHHTHGLIHALLSPLSVGARCHMLEKFDADLVWATLLSEEDQRVNVLMGVPTVYVKLLEKYDEMIKSGATNANYADFVKTVCSQKMRIMLSGSASLPVPVIEKWELVTGHRILERYGMTEVGVVLANPLNGLRRPGFVGTPIKSVEISVVQSTEPHKIIARGDSSGTNIMLDNTKTDDEDEKVSGDLWVKGPSVFKNYWDNPEATKKEFRNGWFITGDSVEFSGGSYKILGRKSVDIIKSGGYKLSALEIETQLLGLDEIKEVAVMGLPDPTWGQVIAALIVWEQEEMNLQQFRELAKTRLAPYACPTIIKTMESLPRNHLGKVNKKELVKVFNGVKA